MAERPPTDTLPLFDPRLPPSSSLLIYLYASRVVATRRWGTKVPLAAVRVDSGRLAGALFAIAFWQLRETGLVRLELARERRLLQTSTQLRITRTTPGKGSQRDGIEGGILDVLTPGSLGKMTPGWESLPHWVKRAAARAEDARDQLAGLATLAGRPNPLRADRTAPLAVPETVTAVVTRWFGSAVHSPEQLPIRWTEREAVAKGYVAVVDARRNPLQALVLGQTVHVPQPEKITALEPSFVDLLARWQAFKANEAVLSDQLEREVVAGINARRDDADSSSAT